MEQSERSAWHARGIDHMLNNQDMLRIGNEYMSKDLEMYIMEGV